LRDSRHVDAADVSVSLTSPDSLRKERDPMRPTIASPATSRGRSGALLTAVLAVLLVLAAAGPAQAIDEASPQVNFKGVAFIDGGQLTDSTSSPSIPARLVWRAYDPSGICSASARLYDYDTGWSTYPSVTLGRDSVRVNLVPGHYYQFQLYLQDCAGNGAYYYDYPQVGPISQETAASLTAGWTTSSCLCWSGGNVLWNTRTGAKASFTFSGQSIAWVTNRASNRGTANIYIDGTFIRSVNLQGATVNRIVGFQKRFGSVATHTLDIVVAGTAGHPRVDIDAFVVAY
jgi:hypothetical protein